MVQDKIISTKFREAIRRTNYTYEQFARMVGLNAKQGLSYILNYKKDENWDYYDIVRYCEALGISVTQFLDDVNRQRTNA